MKIYDISQEVFGCECYPGDPAPKRESLSSIDKGDTCNLSAFYMCAHNGTHVDAPSHFIKDGRSIGEIELRQAVGYAYVAKRSERISYDDALSIIEHARAAHPEAAKRILIGGAEITDGAAAAFAKNGILLIGTELQTVGNENAPMTAHLALLSHDVVILEGIRLSSVPEGVYLLSAAPLKLGGCDGAPCRAVLISLD